MTLHNKANPTNTNNTYSFVANPDPDEDEDEDENADLRCPECDNARFETYIDERWSRRRLFERNPDGTFSSYEDDADYVETIGEQSDYFTCTDCSYEIWRNGDDEHLWHALQDAH